MAFMSVTQAAEEWKISNRRIQLLCSQDRIPGAYKKNNTWLIPQEASKPADARFRSGRFSKKSRMGIADK